jgi:H+-translocating NAD(P) transhydrogenase subunit alpha
MMPSSRTWSWLLVWAVLATTAAAQTAPAATKQAPAKSPAMADQAEPTSPSAALTAPDERAADPVPAKATHAPAAAPETKTKYEYFMAMAFVFMLATFIGIGVIRRVSRLLHTPLMSLTNAISAISVVGAIIVAGGEHYSTPIRVLGAIALFASMTNIISGFLITDRMLKMFKTRDGGKA